MRFVVLQQLVRSSIFTGLLCAFSGFLQASTPEQKIAHYLGCTFPCRIDNDQIRAKLIGHMWIENQTGGDPQYVRAGFAMLGIKKELPYAVPVEHKDYDRLYLPFMGAAKEALRSEFRALIEPQLAAQFPDLVLGEYVTEGNHAIFFRVVGRTSKLKVPPASILRFAFEPTSEALNNVLFNEYKNLEMHGVGAKVYQPLYLNVSNLGAILVQEIEGAQGLDTVDPKRVNAQTNARLMEIRDLMIKENIQMGRNLQIVFNKKGMPFVIDPGLPPEYLQNPGREHACKRHQIDMVEHFRQIKTQLGL